VPALMKILTWLIRGFVFLFILLFAMKNTDPVTLQFYLDHAWTAPLALVLFVALAVGVLLGLVAGLERVVAQRREIISLKRELRMRSTEETRRTESNAATDEPVRPVPDAPLGHP
jgi:lipopolysaccharide assembly protein A